MRFLLLFFLINLSIADEIQDQTKYLKDIQTQIQSSVKKLHPANVALRGKTGDRSGSGSGVIVSKDGLILSAAHVTAGHKIMDVIFNDGTRAKAKVLGSHAKRDMAMLKITTEKNGDWPFSEIGDSAKLKTTDLVISLGHAGGFDAKRNAPVRFGRIVTNRNGGYVTSDCQMIGGDSGGGLFTLDGKLVAIHSNIGSDLSANNHAPVNVATDNWEQLLAGENVSGEWISREERRRPAPKENKDQESDKNKKPSDTEPEKDKEPANKQKQTKPDKEPAADKQKQSKPEKETAKKEEKPAKRKVTFKSIDQDKLRKTSFELFRKTSEENRSKPYSQRTRVKPEQLRQLLVQAGANSEKVTTYSDREISQYFSKMYSAYRSEYIKEMRKLEQERFEKLDKQYRQFLSGLEPAAAKADSTVVAFYEGWDDEIITLGTIVDPRGFILTKHSEIKDIDGLTCEINGERLDTEIVEDWTDHDLALIQVMNDELTAIQFSSTTDLQLGTLLVAPNIDGESPVGIGVVSVAARSLSSKYKGWLGIHLNKVDKGIMVKSVLKKSPAEAAGLKEKDVITHLNGKKTNDLSKFISSVGSKSPGDRVKVALLRGEETINLRVKLGERPKQNTESSRTRRMNEMGGNKRSEFRDGFPNVIQTDIALEPEDQGGPVITLDGDVIGLNIARAGRIKTYTLPSEVILGLLSDVDFHRYINPETEAIKSFELLE